MSHSSNSASTFPFARAAAVIAVAAATGLVAGAVHGAVGRFIYLPLVSPALAALGAGAGSMVALRILRTPGVAFARVVGVLAATTSVIGIMVVTHALMRAELVASLTAKGGSSADALHDAVDSAMTQQGGGAGVTGPVTLRIETGVAVLGASRAELGRTGNAVLLGLEWVLAGFIASALTTRQGRQPFSRRKQAWLTRRVVGRAAEGAAASIIGELEKGQFHRVGRRLDSTRGHVALIAWTDLGWTPGTSTTSEEPIWLDVLTEPSGGRPFVVHRCGVNDAALTAIYESVSARGSERG